MLTREEAKKNIDNIDFLDFQIDIINDVINKIYDSFEVELKTKDEEIALLKSTLSAYAMLKD